MEPDLLWILASIVLAVHVGVILFNLFGLVAVPVGAWRGWRFVRVFWWRALHLAILAVVALQAVFGRACFLTLWQSVLEQSAGVASPSAPLIARWVERLVFWPLPLWFFAALYVGVWIYVLLLWLLVPPVLPGWITRRRRPPA